MSNENLENLTIDQLKQKIKEFETHLNNKQETIKDGSIMKSREKIQVMSDKVVDSNPYRYFF